MKSWKEYLREFEEIAKDLGLTPKETVYEELPSKTIYRLVGQGIPFLPQYWDRGRQYLKALQEHEKGSWIYEIVFNLTPARAYLGKEHSEGVKAMTVAHVLGHSHMFKVSPYEKEHKHLETILTSYVERVEEYERRYGRELVEKAIDLAYALNPTSYGRKTKRTVVQLEQERKGKYDDLYLEATIGKSKGELKEHLAKYGVIPEYVVDKMKKGGIDPNAVIEEIKRELSNPEQTVGGRRRAEEQEEYAKRIVEKNGEEDLIEFFANTIKVLPEWVRDILRMEREIYHAQMVEMPIKILHEGIATWSHEKIISLSSCPEEWKIEATMLSAKVATPLYLRVYDKVEVNDIGERVKKLGYMVALNPYGFGALALRYLEGKGYNPPDVVKTASDYRLINDLLDEDFYFGYFMEKASEISSRIEKGPYRVLLGDIPGKGETENFYAILNDTYKVLKEGNTEEVEDKIALGVANGFISQYYVFLYELAKYMIWTGTEDPVQGAKKMLSNQRKRELPRITAYVDPSTDYNLVMALNKEPQKYVLLVVNLDDSVLKVAKEVEAHKAPLWNSIFLLADQPLDKEYAKKVLENIAVLMHEGQHTERVDIWAKHVVLVYPKQANKEPRS